MLASIADYRRVYGGLWASIGAYPRLFARIRVYLRLPTSIGVCRRLSASIGVSIRASVGVFWRLSASLICVFHRLVGPPITRRWKPIDAGRDNFCCPRLPLIKHVRMIQQIINDAKAMEAEVIRRCKRLHDTPSRVWEPLGTQRWGLGVLAWTFYWDGLR